MTHKNPERVAWLVILGAFIVFLALCAAVPLSIRYYLQHSTTPKQATLEVIGGTVRVRELGVAAPIAVTKSVQLSEGSTIETDENSRGILTFLDLDGSTAILFPDTQITLREMHASTFPWGVEPITLLIDQTRGRIRIGVAPQIPRGDGTPPERSFQVSTLQLSATLLEGSYAVEVGADMSQVTVRDGTATVVAQDQTVKVGRGQRTVVHSGEAPLSPLPIAQDIIVNGDFMDPLARGWNVIRESGTDPALATGTVAQTTLGEQHVVQILRGDSNQTSAITGIVQQINREVSDYRAMRLVADIRLHDQSLPGGGILSSEYPVILRLKYRDQYGSEAEWVHGFYYQNVTNNPTVNGELVPQDVWVPFETGNLFEIADPRPFFITSLTIYASGWDYDAYVSGVRLIVE
jgi:hypothetical protein